MTFFLQKAIVGKRTVNRKWKTYRQKKKKAAGEQDPPLGGGKNTYIIGMGMSHDKQLFFVFFFPQECYISVYNTKLYLQKALKDQF